VTATHSSASSSISAGGVIVTSRDTVLRHDYTSLRILRSSAVLLKASAARRLERADVTVSPCFVAGDINIDISKCNASKDIC